MGVTQRRMAEDMMWPRPRREVLEVLEVLESLTDQREAALGDCWLGFRNKHCLE